MPRSDLVLFVTSADRPFTETERAFLEQVRGWGKKVVIVINKIDILVNESERETVRNFVTESADSLLGFSPEVLPVSSRLALRAKSVNSGLGRQRIEALERYIAAPLTHLPGDLKSGILGRRVSLAERIRASSAIGWLSEGRFNTLDESIGNQHLSRRLAGTSTFACRTSIASCSDGAARQVLRRDDADRPRHGSPECTGCSRASESRCRGHAAADRAESREL